MPLFLAFLLAIVRDRADLVAENLALRHQLACLVNTKSRPRIRPVDRLLWAWLSRLWPGWGEVLVIVKPATVIGWHRAGWRLFWRWKSRPCGRPTTSPEIRKLIRQMALANVGWGAPRIHGELRKLGITISQATVSRCMPRRPAPPGSEQRWKTFIGNHLGEMLAIDFVVVPTITFGLVYVFFVIELGRRRVLHFNVTRHPTAEWTAQQVVEACAFELPGRFLVRDNDRIYGAAFRRRVASLGLEEIKTALRSPWQNGYAERWIASLRRDCLDHIIALSEGQVRRVIGKYVEYYHADRTHLGLDKDPPEPRAIEPPEIGRVVAVARVGGLHHRYVRRAA